MNQDPSSLEPQNEHSSVNTLTGVLRFLRVVRLRKGIVLCSLLVSGLLGGLYYATATRLYQSEAQLLVLQTGGGVLDNTSANQRLVQDFIPTHQKILTSEKVLRAAVRALPKEHRTDLKGIPREKWTETIRGKLSVGSARGTNLIDVRYRSQAAETATVVVDGVLASYLEFMNETHRDSARDLLDVLTREKTELEQNLATKEAELLQLREESEIFSVGDKGVNTSVSRVITLNDALVEAQKKTLEIRALVAAIEEAVRNGEDLHQFVLQEVETVGRGFLMREMGLESQDAHLQGRVLQQLMDHKADLNNKMMQYGRSHPIVRELEERIRITQQWLDNHHQVVAENLRQVRHRELGPRLLQMVRQKLLNAVEHEQSLLKQFEHEKELALTLNNRMAKIDILNLDLRRMRSFHDLLLERMKDIDLGQDHGLRTAVVSEPQVATAPISPRLRAVVLVCLMLGTGVGVAAVYVLDTLDDRFRSPEELTVQLDVPVLSMVRQMEPAAEKGIEAVQVFARPNDVESESFRTLRTSISFAQSNTQRLMGTSSEPGDGKTTVMANLAVAFAQSGKRTIVIDADMRRPGLSTLLNLRGSKGLSQVLRDERPVAESSLDNLCPSGTEGLDVLPSGPRPANPAELLAGERFSELLSWAETVYDQVLIDAPPVLAVTDPAIVGRLVDGVVLVVRPDKNRRKLVIRALDSLRTVDIQVLGLVLNHLTAETGGDYYGYGYGYGYGYEYGHDESEEMLADREIDPSLDGGDAGHPHGEEESFRSAA